MQRVMLGKLEYKPRCAHGHTRLRSVVTPHRATRTTCTSRSNGSSLRSPSPTPRTSTPTDFMSIWHSHIVWSVRRDTCLISRSTSSPFQATLTSTTTPYDASGVFPTATNVPQCPVLALSPASLDPLPVPQCWGASPPTRSVRGWPPSTVLGGRAARAPPSLAR